MPGYGWSIPASYCKTGSKLAEIKGTPCFSCYAKKGRYAFPNVHSAMTQRYTAWVQEDNWIELMAMRLLIIDNPYFRWFDSGDLQGAMMLADICRVAESTPDIHHWLPTQERKIVEKTFSFFKFSCPSNLTIRISSPKVGLEVKSKIEGALSSSVGTTESRTNWNCPSRKQGNKCVDCRACWDKSIEHVVYSKH